MNGNFILRHGSGIWVDHKYSLEGLVSISQALRLIPYMYVWFWISCYAYHASFTLYKCEFELRNVITALEDDLTVIQKWCSDDSMIANTSKFQFMIFGAKLIYKLKLQIVSKGIIHLNQVKWLGIIIDDRIKFHNHICTICIKADNRANVLGRICHRPDTYESMLLYNTLFDSTFNYCSLVWAFCTTKSNTLINKVHVKALRKK